MEKLAKEYYKSYVASNEILSIHHRLAEEILAFKPKSVFEFGCGSGKNLRLLKEKSDKITKSTGIDISYDNIKNTRSMNQLDDCWLADENFLKKLLNNTYDVVFTCSVLDHIESIFEIIKDFKRIARKGVVLLETNDISTRYPYYYYPHNYEEFSFNKVDYSYLSNEAPDADGCKYEIWTYNKNELDGISTSQSP